MKSSALLKFYNDIEKKYPVAVNPGFADLVVPNGNSNEPFHRWFHVKEGFSSRLLQRVLQHTMLIKQPHLSVLDSFMGGGTTVVSSLLLNQPTDTPIVAYGIERNPFLEFVASTKVKTLQNGAPKFNKFVRSVISLSRSSDITIDLPPGLSTFNQSVFFPLETITQLMRLRSAIELAEGTQLEKDLASLCLASAIEPVSALRRDGRALRYVPNKQRPEVMVEFKRRCSIISADAQIQSLSTRNVHVFLGDGRNPCCVLPDDRKFNLVLFSPPYPNNIDYTEVYKMEAWFLGFINSQEDFRNLRLLTLRSHPSIRFSDTYATANNGFKKQFENLIYPLIEEIPEDKNSKARRRLIWGYFDDLFQTVINHRNLLTKEGRLVFVVGNSLHGNGSGKFLIAADLIITRLAEMAGYKVESFIVARHPTRRSATLPLLRESIVCLSIDQ